MKILCVCGMGLGSSLLLKMQVEGALKELGVRADVEVADSSTAKAMPADLIVTSAQFAEMLGDRIKTVTIKNYTDKKEIREKLEAALREG